MTVLNASVANQEFRQAEGQEQAEALIEHLLNTDHSSWESHLSVTEELIDPEQADPDWCPDQDLTLAVDPESGYGALRWVADTPPTGPSVTLAETEVEVDLLTEVGLLITSLARPLYQ